LRARCVAWRRDAVAWAAQGPSDDDRDGEQHRDDEGATGREGHASSAKQDGKVASEPSPAAAAAIMPSAHEPAMDAGVCGAISGHCTVA